MIASCPFSYELLNNPSNSAETTWAAIDAGTGEIKLDKDTLGSSTLKVRYTFPSLGGGVATIMSLFTLIVYCSPFTLSTISNFDFDVPFADTGSKSLMLANTDYIIYNSHITGCPCTYQVMTTLGDTSVSCAAASCLLEELASGHVMVNKNIVGNEDVKIEVTMQNEGTSLTPYILATNHFNVNIDCTLFTIGAISTPKIWLPDSSTATVANTFITGGSHQEACPITYSLVDGADGTTPISLSWLTIDATTGVLTVDRTNRLSQLNVKIRIDYDFSPNTKH